MSISQNIDRATPLLPFAPGDLDRCGVRMNRAEFARFLGVSKQAVGEWTRAGKITLGVDGLLDPRQAVAQLLRNSDPARVRSRVLEPLVRELGALQRRAADLATQLAQAKEAAEFSEGAWSELWASLGAVRRHLADEWPRLRELPPELAVAALEQWIEAAVDAAGDPGFSIADQARIASPAILGYDVATAPPAPDAFEASRMASLEGGAGSADAAAVEGAGTAP